MNGLDFDKQPFLVIWEATQACDLACKHCRAQAQPIAHPQQLTTAEGMNLIDQISDLHVPIFVLTGGDPLKRADIFDLVRYANSKGVHTALAPSATPLLTREAIFKAKEAGVVRLSVSLDGSCPEIHDVFRGVEGTFERTRLAVQYANEAGLPIQVHTTVSRHNIHDLDNVATLLTDWKIAMWNIFMLVPVGRGKTADLLDGEDFEKVFEKIYELSTRVPYQIKTTEGMHYRRFLLQKQTERKRAAEGHVPDSEDAMGAAREADAHGDALRERGGPMYAGTHSWATRRINDGKGFVFVSHTGEIYPSGFLPLQAGNIRDRSLAEIYQEAPIFKVLRNTSLLDGKCGVCEFKQVCGGSRARAFAVTGDVLAQEPCCIYQPQNWHPVAQDAHPLAAEMQEQAMEARRITTEAAAAAVETQNGLNLELKQLVEA
jgi:radical SAM protein